MAIRSLISLYALLATPALITQSAEATVYSQPNTSNPIEASIKDIRNSSWSLFLRPNNAIFGETDQARSWEMVVASHGRMVVVASGRMEAEKIGKTVVDEEMVVGGMEAVASGKMVVKVS